MSVVVRSLALHKSGWVDKCKERSTAKDPHMNLKINIPSIEQMGEILDKCAEAGNTQLGLAFLSGTGMYVRGQRSTPRAHPERTRLRSTLPRSPPRCGTTRIGSGVSRPRSTS